MKFYTKIVLLAGLFAACQHPAPVQQKHAPDAPTSDTASPGPLEVPPVLWEIPELSDSLILATVFGSSGRDTSKETPRAWVSNWQYGQFKDTTNQREFPYPVDENLVARVATKQVYQNGERCIAVFGSTAVEETCHVCGGVMGAAIFCKTPGGWAPKIVNRFILLSGSGGQPSKALVYMFGKNKPAIVFPSEYMGQGIYTVSLNLGGLWENKLCAIPCEQDMARAKAVLGLANDASGQQSNTLEMAEASDPLVLHQDNSGNCELGPDNAPYDMACFNYDGTISFPPGNSSYYDMLIQFSGKKLKEINSKRAAPFREIWRFRLVKGIYYRVQ